MMDDSNVLINNSPTSFKNLFISPDKKSNLFFVTLNIANCIIGNGIIALPYASQKSGLCLAFIISIIAAELSSLTCYLLCFSCHKTGCKSYSAIVEKILGKKIKIILTICNICFPLFVSIAYGIAISDNLLEVFQFIAPKIIFTQSRFLILACLCVIILPLSILKHLAFLEKFSMLSIFFVVFYTISFAIRTPYYSSHILLLEETWNLVSSGIVQSFSTLFFSFSIHHNIVPLYFSLRNNTLTRFSVSIFTATTFSSLIYIIIIICGSLSFSDAIYSNLFLNYCYYDKLIVAARILFTFTLIITFPFQIVSAREAIIEQIKVEYRVNLILRVIITIVLISFCGVLSAVTKSIGIVIQIGGSLTAAPMILMFPPLLYLKTRYKKYLIFKPMVIFMWTLIVFGGAIMIIGSVMAIYDIFIGEVQTIRYWCF